MYFSIILSLVQLVERVASFALLRPKKIDTSHNDHLHVHQ